MRKKATIYVDPELLRAVKIQAAREEKAEYQVVEEALRAHLGHDVLDELWEQNRPQALAEDEALQLSYRELKASRRSKRRG